MNTNPGWLRFSELPTPHQAAIHEYTKLGATDSIDRFRFRVDEIPMPVAQQRTLDSIALLDCDNWLSWDEYHTWYLDQAGARVKDHGDSRWPSILSSVPGEFLEDGWHRFHSYARAGDATLPVVEMRSVAAL